MRVWDAATGALRRELKGHTSGVNAVAVAPDGAWLASGSDDKSVRVWDAATGALARSFAHGAAVHSVQACQANAALCLTAAAEWLFVRDVRSGATLAAFRSPTMLSCAALGGGGGAVALGASNGACLLYTSPSPRDQRGSRMPSSA